MGAQTGTCFTDTVTWKLDPNDVGAVPYRDRSTRTGQ
jgi:hypothetical protein